MPLGCQILAASPGLNGSWEWSDCSGVREVEERGTLDNRAFIACKRCG